MYDQYHNAQLCGRHAFSVVSDCVECDIKTLICHTIPGQEAMKLCDLRTVFLLEHDCC